MANPQVENGYIKIANEVFEHLLKLRVSCSELQVCMAVIRKTWGWKKKIVPISLLDLQKLTDYPERTVAQAVTNLSKRKILICEKGGGRGNPSKWSFDKDWETWQSLHKPSEIKHATINSAEINTVYPCSQTLQASAEITAETCRVSPCNLLPVIEQLAPKATLKESKAIKAHSSPSVDEAFDYFVDLFFGKTGSPYMSSKGDFVQLATLRKSFKIQGKETPPEWHDACRNYLNSPKESYSIAYMVTGNRYAVFRKSKINQYNKPENVKNHIGSLPLIPEEIFEDPEEPMHGMPDLIEKERERRRAKYNNDPELIEEARRKWEESQDE